MNVYKNLCLLSALYLDSCVKNSRKLTIFWGRYKNTAVDFSNHLASSEIIIFFQYFAVLCNWHALILMQKNSWFNDKFGP
jgi:hypothetical protein